MSIIIKGMGMPSHCYDCPLCYDMMSCTATGLRFYSDTVDLSIDPADGRMHNCPLIELPPHGRLGDLDALADYIDLMMAQHTRVDAFEMVQNAPAIIPADPGGEPT